MVKSCTLQLKSLARALDFYWKKFQNRRELKKAMNVAIIIHQNEDLATSKYEDSMFAKEKADHKI